VKSVDINEAKTALFALLTKVEQIVITRNGKRIAQLTHIEPKPRRQPGLLREVPAWRDFAFAPSVFAPLHDETLAAEGWPM
jgi:antitoxin (DNA-binding transcriptional repressor) of toxin-antitoxin stability system